VLIQFSSGENSDVIIQLRSIILLNIVEDFIHITGDVISARQWETPLVWTTQSTLLTETGLFDKWV